MPIYKALLRAHLVLFFKNSLCACPIQAAESPMCVLQLKSISREGRGCCLSFQAPVPAYGCLPTYCHTARCLALPPPSMGQGGCFAPPGSRSHLDTGVLTSASPWMAGKGVSQEGAERSRWPAEHYTPQDSLILNFGPQV